jgi:hypothetical protein
MQLSREVTTHCILLKTVFTNENGEQSTNHQLYNVLRDKKMKLLKRKSRTT